MGFIFIFLMSYYIKCFLCMLITIRYHISEVSFQVLAICIILSLLNGLYKFLCILHLNLFQKYVNVNIISQSVHSLSTFNNDF